MIETLKKEICRANLDLVREGLVVQTWGNVSGVNRARGLMVIKPSGVPYKNLKADQMVVISLETGKVVAGSLRPSSDTPTHLLLYREFKNIGGIAHTHSLYATAWAQAGRGIPVFGTTHADYWHGEVPVTRELRPQEIEKNYEENTGRVIVERFKGLNPLNVPAALVASHGPFAWGKDAGDAVHNAAVLEFVARLASETLRLNPGTKPIQCALLDAHFLRKHGPGPTTGKDIPLDFMLVVYIQISVKPECVAAFQEATIANARESLKEPGIARFDFMQETDAPTRFLLVEAYRNAEAPAKHKETRHYQIWRDAVASMMAGPRVSIKFNNLYPPDDAL